MAKIGRNDPCLCGSGKKYKQCCLANDEAATRAASPPPETKLSRRYARAAALAEMAAEYAAAEELTETSNAVVDMVHAGKLDEAEQAANQLLERFPEVHDGYDRLGMVYEARGDKRTAAKYYRKALAFIRESGDSHAPEMEETYLRLIDRLEPPAAEA
jgi:tetratricopeptide (TPR) repeat protein